MWETDLKKIIIGSYFKRHVDAGVMGGTRSSYAGVGVGLDGSTITGENHQGYLVIQYTVRSGSAETDDVS